MLVITCNSGQTGQLPASSSQRSIQYNTIAGDTLEKTATRPLKGQNEIIGVWKVEAKESLTVQIDRDSIYWIEHRKSHKYHLKSDSIFIHYADFIFAANVYFNGDTLVLASENGESKYIKFKQQIPPTQH